MNIFKHILLTLALTPIAVAQYQYPDEITEPKGMQDIMAEIVSGKYRMKQASAAPWSDEVVATSAHIEAFIENELCKSEDFDVKFVNKATNQIAKWRDPVGFEPLQYKGKLEVLSEDRKMSMVMESTSEGIALRRTVVYWKGEKVDWLWLGTGTVIRGMSGGPVIASSDGSVVGIIMGRPAKGLKKYAFEEEKYGDLTLIVPYSVVDYVWRNCKK